MRIDSLRHYDRRRAMLKKKVPVERQPIIIDDFQTSAVDASNRVAVEVREHVIVHPISEAIPFVALVYATEHIEGLILSDLIEEIAEVVLHLRRGAELLHEDE